MPQISRFLGIIVSMYFDDHNPPHFDARYDDDEVIVDINHLTVLEAHLPARALGMVIEWASEHPQELRDSWVLTQNFQSLVKIAPLR